MVICLGVIYLFIYYLLYFIIIIYHLFIKINFQMCSLLVSYQKSIALIFFWQKEI